MRLYLWSCSITTIEISVLNIYLHEACEGSTETALAAITMSAQCLVLTCQLFRVMFAASFSLKFIKDFNNV